MSNIVANRNNLNDYGVMLKLLYLSACMLFQSTIISNIVNYYGMIMVANATANDVNSISIGHFHSAPRELDVMRATVSATAPLAEV